jgi:putative ABC transport system ATP-binding protein
MTLTEASDGRVALRAEGLVRVFPSAAGDVHAVDGIDIELRTGELLAVRGASGAGKTTLLNLLGVLDRPTAGRVWIGDVDTTGLPEAELATLRRDALGFVFQSFGLIPVLSARENVELPLRIAGTDPAERDERVAEALAMVGLAAHTEQRPAELSGGQQQRVGIARAIVARPRVLIADEPTGQLDSRTAATIMDLLGELAHRQGLAAIVSTHDPLLVGRADRVIEVHDGRILGSDADPQPGPSANGGRPVDSGVAGSDVESGAPGTGRETDAASSALDEHPPLTRAEARRRSTPGS